MLPEFISHLSKNFPFLKGKKLLLAVSGGIDSMVMAEIFRRSGYSISIAHCNFNLRGNESDGDQLLIENYAASHNLNCYVTSFDTKSFATDNKLSIQVAARQLRYIWFEELLKDNNLDYVLTAHHADDDIETFLINFTRGTGVEGLTGIPKQNNKIIRSLLAFSREQIEAFANANNIHWREDSSNASDKYLRNKIRHDIVPVLKGLNPSLVNSFIDTLEHIEQAKSMMEDAAALVYKEVVIEKEDRVIFRIFELKRLANYRAYLYYWLKGFGFTAWDDIYNLPDSQSGSQIFSNGFVLLKDREILILTQKKQEPAEACYFIGKETTQVDFPVHLSLTPVPGINTTTNDCIFVDADKLQFPLEIRKWREGDSFRPFGMAGTKTVSKFFKDEKFSLIDKSGAWLLCSDNEVVWIIGKRMDDRYKITENTKNIIQIKTT